MLKKAIVVLVVLLFIIGTIGIVSAKGGIGGKIGGFKSSVSSFKSSFSKPSAPITKPISVPISSSSSSTKSAGIGSSVKSTVAGWKDSILGKKSDYSRSYRGSTSSTPMVNNYYGNSGGGFMSYLPWIYLMNQNNNNREYIEVTDANGTKKMVPAPQKSPMGIGIPLIGLLICGLFLATRKH